MSIETRVQKIAIELLGADLGPAGSPPGRLGFPMVKSHATKEARVAENKRAAGLLQNEVIVFLWPKPRGLGPHLPAHAKMEPDPIAAGKFEEYLLAARVRAEEALSD